MAGCGNIIELGVRSVSVQVALEPTKQHPPQKK